MAELPSGPSDRRDVKLFVACLLVGFAGIGILKAVVDNQLIVTAFPCAVLGAYIWYVWATQRYQLRGDRAGDSVYYLGFLYTLLSLGISLYQFTQDQLAARDIVGNLGIALFTTIMGLAGRVVLTQLREDPIEIEESARLTLAQAAARVRAELLQTVEDFNIFRRATTQVLSESVGEISKSLAKIAAIEAPESLVASQFEPLAHRLRTILDDFARHTSEQQAATDQFRDSLAQSAEGLRATLQSVDEALKALALASAAVRSHPAGSEPDPARPKAAE